MSGGTERRPRLVFAVTSEQTALAFLGGYLAHLKTAGWDVALVCSPDERVAEFARAEGVAYRPIAMRRDPAPLHDVRALIDLTRLLARMRPDAVVYATPKASLLTSIASRVVGVRARVYEIWGLRLETAGGVGFRVLRALERLTCALSTHLVANSPSLAARVGEVVLDGREDVMVLGSGSSHGVDVERFSRSAPMPPIDEATERALLSTSGFTVGFVGRLHPDKGLDTLLDALALCHEAGVSVRGLIVGGDEGALDREHYSGGVPLHFAGAVSDVRPYLAEMDVLVLMSLREGFPNVVLEAASMNVPAIVAGSTGTVDSVIDGETGRVLPVGDVEGLAQAIAELDAEPKERERLGIVARRRVVDDFAQETVWQLHADFFAAATGAHEGVLRKGDA